MHSSVQGVFNFSMVYGENKEMTPFRLVSLALKIFKFKNILLMIFPQNEFLEKISADCLDRALSSYKTLENDTENT